MQQYGHNIRKYFEFISTKCNFVTTSKKNYALLKKKKRRLNCRANIKYNNLIQAEFINYLLKKLVTVINEK